MSWTPGGAGGSARTLAVPRAMARPNAARWRAERRFMVGGPPGLNSGRGKPDNLVPTLRVRMPSSTLRVGVPPAPDRGRGAARKASPRGPWERDYDVTMTHSY